MVSLTQKSYTNTCSFTFGQLLINCMTQKYCSSLCLALNPDCSIPFPRKYNLVLQVLKPNQKKFNDAAVSTSEYCAARSHISVGIMFIAKHICCGNLVVYGCNFWEDRVANKYNSTWYVWKKWCALFDLKTSPLNPSNSHILEI